MRRRTVLAGLGAAGLAAPALAQPARARTLRLVPQANLTLLDPHFTTAQVTTNHAWATYDTLFSINRAQEPLQTISVPLITGTQLPATVAVTTPPVLRPPATITLGLPISMPCSIW